MFPLDFLGEPNLAIAQLVKSRLELFLQSLDLRKLEKRLRFFRAMIGHIHIAPAG
jgi:hypothetical protein